MDGYSAIVCQIQQMDLNAAVLQKADGSLRLDAMAEVSATKLFETLMANERVHEWFHGGEWKCLSVRSIDTYKGVGSDIYCMTLQKKSTKYDFLFRRFVKQNKAMHSYQVVLSASGLEALKFKLSTNKRLAIDYWGFALSQRGVTHDAPLPVAEEPKAKVFCYVQSKKDSVREVMGALTMQMIENAAQSLSV